MWRVAAVGNLLHMKDEALKRCTENVMAQQNSGPGDLMDFVIRTCEEPRWKSDEIFENLKSNLMLLKVELINKAARLKDTLYMLENSKKKKPRKARVENIRGLLKLTQSRIYIADSMLREDKFAKRYFQLKRKEEL